MKLIYDDRIEPYLKNEMGVEEKASFEQEMSMNEELRTSVIFYREAAYSAERVHDRELLAKESKKTVYKIQNIWFRFQRLYYRARFAVISALTAVLIALSSLGGAVVYAVQTAQRLLAAGSPYVGQLAVVVSRGGDEFPEIEAIDKQLELVNGLLSKNDIANAQEALDKAVGMLDSVVRGDKSDDFDIAFKERSDLAEFIQAIIYTQDGKGLKAKRLLKKISADETHLYRDDALDILSSK